MIIFWIYASCIIEHHEALAQGAVLVFVDITLVLYEFLPPLRILIVYMQYRLVKCLPFVCCGYGRVCLARNAVLTFLVGISPRLSYIERCAYAFIACSFAAEVCHPVAVLVCRHAVVAIPLPRNERRESASLVHIPAAGLIVEDATECAPFKEIVALGKPCGIAASVGAITAVIYHVCHIPFIAFAIDRRAVYLMAVVGRSNHHSIFVWRFHLLVYATHCVV